ncbi:TRAP transporter permease [Chloroflexota bacterium]
MEKVKKGAEIGVYRYDELPKPVKTLILICIAAGIGSAVFYVFSFSIKGQALLDVSYYYLLMALFGSTVFLYFPARKKDTKVPWYDYLAAGAFFGIAIYYSLHSFEIRVIGWLQPTQLQFVLALVFWILILEATRRGAGSTFVAVVVILGFYPLFASHMPGMFFGVEYSFTTTIAQYIYGGEGVAGLVSKVMGDVLLGFLLFAGILIASGAGNFFIDLAMAILGRYRGGPAKVAVVASGFFGSLSGSAVANVAATGSVTIPAMKRLGYPPHYAAAIEACASTGGVIMPPVMGAVAFVMAVVLSMPYAVIMMAALIPAILYYITLLLQVDAYAVKAGLKGIPREEIPSIKKTLKGGWIFLFIMAFLVWGLVHMKWEQMAPFYASALLIPLSFLSRRENWMTPKKIIKALGMVGSFITRVLAIILSVGIILASLSITGMDASFSTGLVALGKNSLVVAMFLGLAACYIMGMAGLAIAAYILLSLSLAPAMMELGGFNILSVHLFIVYYTLLAGITPPVAVVAFVAAAIADAPIMKTGFLAMRLGIGIYLIPIFFLFNPALILQGPVMESLYLFSLCVVGIVFIAAGLEGYLLKLGKIELWARPLLVIAGILIGFPEWKSTIFGFVLATATIALMLIRGRKVATKAPVSY